MVKLHLIFFFFLDEGAERKKKSRHRLKKLSESGSRPARETRLNTARHEISRRMTGVSVYSYDANSSGGWLSQGSAAHRRLQLAGICLWPIAVTQKTSHLSTSDTEEHFNCDFWTFCYNVLQHF